MKNIFLNFTFTFFSNRLYETKCFLARSIYRMAEKSLTIKHSLVFYFVGWDLRHQVLRPLLAYCTAPDDR
jgi:hypothetical protein